MNTITLNTRSPTRLRLSDYRHRVTLQLPVVEKDNYGGVIRAWQNVVTVWAAIEPLRGRELWAAQQANSEVQGRIRIPYRPTVTPAMRVLWGKRVFRIISVVHPNEDRRETHLLYREALD